MTIETSSHDGVFTITINRPERHNALDDATSDALHLAWHEAADDPDSRVILLRAEGKSFCSGRDVGALGTRARGESDYVFVRRHQDQRLHTVGQRKPIVAAVQGHALGGGLELALSADIRIAAEDIQLAFPEVHYGLMTDTGGSAFATVLAGPSRAKLMLMTGRRIGAHQALAWGLVDEVVGRDDLDVTARSLALEIAGKSELAVTAIKQVVDEAWHAILHSSTRAELLAQTALFSSPEYVAAKQARQSS